MKKKGEELGNVTVGKVSSGLHLPSGMAGRKVAMLALAVIVVVGGIGLYLHYFPRNSVSQQQAFKEMITQEQKAHLKGDDKEAKKLLTDFVDKYPHLSKEQTYTVASSFVAIYRTAGDYKSAQEWQIKAMDSSPKQNFTEYYNLAEVCYRNNDKECAIKYYQKALDELNNKAKINGIDGYKYLLNARLKELKK